MLKFNNAVVTMSYSTLQEWQKLIKYIVSERFTYTFSIDIFAICQVLYINNIY